MATFNHISGAEPSTITFKAATVSMTRNSSVMHQELISLADPESSLSVARISSAAPASSDAGLIVRQVGYVADSTSVSIAGPTSTAAPASNDTGVVVRQVGFVAFSTTVSVAAMPAGSTSVTVSTFPANSSLVQLNVIAAGYLSSAVAAANSSALLVRIVGGVSSAVDNPVRAVLSSTNTDNPVLATIGTNLQSSVAGSSGSSALLVREIIDIVLTTASSNAFGTSTSFTIQSSAASIRNYVTAYSIMCTNAGPTKIAFYSAGTMMWPIVLAAVSSAISGANLAVSAPSYIFRTAAAEAFTLQMGGSSVAGFKAAVSYFRAP